MKVILLQNIPKIGKKYEIKNVSDGYAANFLIPRKLAEVATHAVVTRLNNEKARHEGEQNISHDLLVKNIQSLNGVKVEMTLSANEQGHLFAGVHLDEIVAALKEQSRLDIPTEYISLEKPIKNVGEHTIPVVTGDVSGSFTLVIKSA